MEGYLVGSTCEGSMDDPDTYKKIEKLTNQYVKEHVLETIKKVQKDYGVDIFGFGEVVADRITKTSRKFKIIGMKPLKTLK